MIRGWDSYRDITNYLDTFEVREDGQVPHNVSWLSWRPPITHSRYIDVVFGASFCRNPLGNLISVCSRR